ncbi:hypothetical protein HY484_02510 [Candidatus Woesearchaeota archaeon]|nr:hypothetical protein [Candidatus Woesearchaeota archaeon]
MKALKLLLIISIVALFVLAGCSTSAQKSSLPSGQRYVGGGCGVAAPASNAGVAETFETEPALLA